VLHSDRVKKYGKKDQQDQVGSLVNKLQQRKNSCLSGHQKSGQENYLNIIEQLPVCS